MKYIKCRWICTAWLKLVFLISLVPNAVNSSSVLSLPFVAKRISPQNPSNPTFGTQRMVTQNCTDSLHILRIHVTLVTWTWGNNERKPNSIVSTSPRDLPRLSPVACRDAGLATQNFTKITRKWHSRHWKMNFPLRPRCHILNVSFMGYFPGSSRSCSQKNQFLRAWKNELCRPKDDYTVDQVKRSLSVPA